MEDNGWKFAQCFGDKGEVEEVANGIMIYTSRSCIHAFIHQSTHQSISSYYNLSQPLSLSSSSSSHSHSYLLSLTTTTPTITHSLLLLLLHLLSLTTTTTDYYWHVIADVISAVEFDHSGDFLATGDRGGRVVLFERNEGVSTSIQTH